MSNLNFSKNFLGLGDLFFHNPKRYLPVAQLLAGVMEGDEELTHSDREAIALYTSRINNCHYCINAHKSVLHALNQDAAFIENVAEGDINDIDEKFRAVLIFSKQLTVEPHTMNEHDISLVRNAGWSDNAIESVICVVSLFSMINRIVHGFNFPGSDEHYQQFAGMVSQSGYSPLVSMIEQKIK